MVESEAIPIAEFTVLFDGLFMLHDKNANGALEIEEARAFMIDVNSSRPDGAAFDEERFSALFTAKAVDGKIPKDVCHAVLLARGQQLGFVANQ